MGTQWHAMDKEEVLAALDVTPRGLSIREVEERLERYGRNEIETEKKVSKWGILWSQVKNPLVAVLLGAVIISLVSGHSTDAIVIVVIIGLNTLIGFFQEYGAERALRALKELAAPQAKVLRYDETDGQSTETEVSAADVVPGDVVILEAGDKAPADARILEATSLTVDESMLTGESVAVAKVTSARPANVPIAERKNMIYAGTIIARGRGKAVITTIGDATELGLIASLIRKTEKAPSPLQLQTLDLGKKLGLLAVSAGLLTFVIGLLRGIAIGDIFFLSLASVVSSIPEGLPAVMTITLAVGVSRMAKRNAIIRRLHAVDTLGAATVICTDKTGTLTTNEMTVQQILVNGQIIRVSGVGFASTGSLTLNGSSVNVKEDEFSALALRVGALCNDAKLVRSQIDGRERSKVRGDPTEGALLVAAEKAGLQIADLVAEFPRIDEIPFDPNQKYMATFHQRPSGDILVCVKGAPEVILEMCSTAAGEGTKGLSIDRGAILQFNEEMASSGLRVLALAYQVIDPEAVEEFKTTLTQGQHLIFSALMGMMDPPRPEAGPAVQQCKRAGIRVIMLTGDHRLTAKTIAARVGILDKDGVVLTGSELIGKSDAEFDALMEKVAVLARLSPEHKHRVVESLRRQGHVVAMTGDGVNDAPALKASEIGVAMGIAGTDVAKEAADMVLTDDNFASIVGAIEEGRAVFQNVRKVVKFLLTTNIGEDLAIISALLLFPPGWIIITPLQILWVNLVTDGLLDINIAMEPKERNVMDDPPRKRKDGIINRDILLSMVFVATLMAIGTIGAFAWLSPGRGLAHAQTIAFTTMAMFQVFNSLNCRSRTQSVFQLGLFTNRYLVGAIGLSVFLQVAANRLPMMRKVLGTEPLPLGDWLVIIMIAGSVFVADELRKYVSRRRRARRSPVAQPQIGEMSESSNA